MTVLHDNMAVARVGDLTLRVALERALGAACVPLGEDFIAFPKGLIDEARRVVVRSGYVVKEVAARES